MTTDKGLKAGALGLVGNVVIGLAASRPRTAWPPRRLCRVAVGDKAPAMFVLAFIPMLLVAFAYKELARDTPDCGTTFTWATKAFGPWIGWIGGWGLAVSAIIVLANVAEIAAIYLSSSSASTRWPRTSGQGASVVLHRRDDLVSPRHLMSERMQNVLIAVQFGVLVIVSVIALFRVFAGTAGAQAISPQLSWLCRPAWTCRRSPQAIILCIFIYWGWDACLAVGEETKDPIRPRHRGGHHHSDPGVHLRVGGLRGAVVLRFQRDGDRPQQPRQHRRRADGPRRARRRRDRGVAAAADRVGVRAVVHPDDDPADRTRHAVDGRVRSDPEAFRQRPPAGT